MALCDSYDCLLEKEAMFFNTTIGDEVMNPSDFLLLAINVTIQQKRCTAQTSVG